MTTARPTLRRPTVPHVWDTDRPGEAMLLADRMTRVIAEQPGIDTVTLLRAAGPQQPRRASVTLTALQEIQRRGCKLRPRGQTCGAASGDGAPVGWQPPALT